MDLHILVGLCLILFGAQWLPNGHVVFIIISTTALVNHDGYTVNSGDVL
jgi:hypothetical protein